MHGAQQTDRQTMRATPPPGASVCKWHGGATKAARDKAAQRVQEAQAVALARKMVGEVELARYADPYDCLEFVTSYSFAFAERLAKVVEAIPDDKLRYKGKLGEQLRGEVAAMQRALADACRVATDSVKLGLMERRARIEETQLQQLTVAVEAVLQEAPRPDRAGPRPAQPAAPAARAGGQGGHRCRLTSVRRRSCAWSS